MLSCASLRWMCRISAAHAASASSLKPQGARALFERVHDGTFALFRTITAMAERDRAETQFETHPRRCIWPAVPSLPRDDRP